MANRYDDLFSMLKKDGRKAFIPYTLLGFPDESKSYDSIISMIKGGAAALELGLAFSDPLADGPVIQQASAETIESGFKLKNAFELIEKIRNFDSKIPITVMCYYNSILALGLDGFCKRAANAGVDGILAVDLPPEQSGELAAICKQNALCQIFIISPLTSAQRMQRITELAGGFLYAVSRLGTTGVEERYDENLSSLV
ncbi:MAG: tryptophan synthase subunit alpha, partial [Candidatus Obscuribacterales bacterium]|nr:tryptophan synthase subunit alpha [Candidatus Obscuribacterales bacterium]